MPGTTGLAPLPDTGVLSYNGVQFSSLYKSKLEGKVVPDAANRTTRYMEWTLQVDGVVTLEQGLPSTDQTWGYIRQRLSVHGALLTYSGQGFNTLKAGGAFPADVAWGPVPEVLNFQPLGQARSSFISWRCTVRVPELPNAPKGTLDRAVGGFPGPVVQFNYESALSYDEEGYATVTLRGTLEIPLQRGPQNTRALTKTVDDFRQGWLNIQFDLTKYRVARREFPMSRDKRTYEWEYQATELSPAGLPLGHTGARGTMSVRNLKPGGGSQGKILASCQWTCSMKCTYSLRADFPRRVALFAFLSLLWFRMWSTLNGSIPAANDPKAAQANDFRKQALADLQKSLKAAPAPPLPKPPIRAAGALGFYRQLAQNQRQAAQAAIGRLKGNSLAYKASVPLLMDFGFDEGLYDDAKTITFQAAWRIATTFSSLMVATGVWNYAQDVGRNVWATSMADVMGWRGPLKGRIDPNVEVIVDMGGGEPLKGPPVQVESGRDLA